MQSSLPPPSYLAPMRQFTVSIALLASAALPAQAPLNGPMLGHVDMLAATVWMQCQGPCAARIEYWKASSPDSVMRTPVQDSEAAHAHGLDFLSLIHI